MPLEGADRVLLVQELPAEEALPEHDLAQAGKAVPVGPAPGLDLLLVHPPDRVRHALVPLLRVADVEHDLRLGIRRHELLVEIARGPVHRGAKADEQLRPVHRLSCIGGQPQIDVLWLCKQGDERVTRGEPEFLKGRFGRRRPRPRDTGSNHLHTRPTSSLQRGTSRIMRGVNTVAATSIPLSSYASCPDSTEAAGAGGSRGTIGSGRASPARATTRSYRSTAHSTI